MIVELEYTVLIAISAEVRVRFGRPAPIASDPDSPAFSDPGAPIEVDVHEVRVNGVEMTKSELIPLRAIWPNWCTEIEMAAVQEALLSVRDAPEAEDEDEDEDEAL